MLAGIYLHIPFCKSRCSYCDFATDVWRSGEAVDRYVSALTREIDVTGPAINGSPGEPIAIDTIYFGGGTPSLLEPEQVQRVLEGIGRHFDVANNSEVTMEMNPATVTLEKLEAYRSLGVNRASFGVQTFNDRDLKLLARGHDANDARETYRLLRKAGFSNISFDLIAGLPGQTIEDWRRNLDEAVSMLPEHLSLYLLEIHESTPLAEQVRSGRRSPIDNEIAAEMYEIMPEYLAGSGYQQYEISNFARYGVESRHNTKYWTLAPVYGFGVSAHSFDGRYRYANERDTARYVASIDREGSAEAMREEINIVSEYIFLGLRLERGLDLSEFKVRFDHEIEDKFGPEIEYLVDSRLLIKENGRIRLTRKGKLYSNEVFASFV